jgi:hypothetical protein
MTGAGGAVLLLATAAVPVKATTNVTAIAPATGAISLSAIKLHSLHRRLRG